MPNLVDEEGTHCFCTWPVAVHWRGLLTVCGRQAPSRWRTRLLRLSGDRPWGGGTRRLPRCRHRRGDRQPQNVLLLKLLDEQGVEVYPGSVT